MSEYNKFFSTYNNVSPPPIIDIKKSDPIEPDNTSINNPYIPVYILESKQESKLEGKENNEEISFHTKKVKRKIKEELVRELIHEEKVHKDVPGSIRSVMKNKGDIVRDVYNTLIDENFTPEQACGILGNIMQESSFNATNHSGDGGKSYGLFQFYESGELPIYKAWKIKNSSRIKGKPEHVILTMFVAERMKNSKFRAVGIKTETAYNYFNSTDPSKIAEGFNALFEKSADYKHPERLNKRKQYAQAFYNYFK